MEDFDISKLSNVNAEKAIIAQSILSREDYVKARDRINSHDFYDNSLSVIFKAIGEVYKTKDKCDYFDLLEVLKHIGSDVEAHTLTSFVSDSPIGVEVETDCDITKDYSMKRNLWKVLQSSQMDLVNNEKFKDISLKLERDILDLFFKIKEKKDPSANKIAIRMLKQTERAIVGEDDSVDVTDPVLKKYLPGYYKGHMIMIGGYTSTGKSTYLMQLVRQMCQVGANVLIFSTEDNAEGKIAKIVSNISDIHYRDIISGNLNNDELKIIISTVADVSKYNLKIYDDILLIEDMRIKIMQEKLKGKVDIVCLDYIQNIKADGNIYEQMSNAVRDLYQMCRDLEVTMIILSQVSNEAQRSESNTIGLKGAGELASVPDMVLWIKRGDLNDIAEKNKLMIIVRKNRAFGTIGFINMRFSDSWCQIIHEEN